MPNFTVINTTEVQPSPQYGAPRRVDGGVHSRPLTPADFPLWMCDAALDDGASIHWRGEHGDDAIYVFSGELEVDGRRCPAGGAVIVESGATTTARAVGDTHIAHFGSVDDRPVRNGLIGPPAADGHGVHVVGPNGMFQSGEAEGVHAVWFADGTCPTCRCQLFVVTAPERTDARGKGHTHSQDEIIYLVDGSIRLGSHLIEPFSALCIAGNARYALGGSASHTFLNFRRDVSEQVYEPGTAPLLETALARGGRAVDDVR